MPYDFTLVDVFSDRAFGGNQLAVFPDARGISDATMQRLAREFNFSETTFVLPPSDPANTCRVRIFTPNQELPFAGHPTVGTAAALAKPDTREFVFEEGIGPVAITIDGPEIGLHLHSPAYETTDQTPPVTAIAKALTLPEDAIVDTWYAGLGLQFCLVRVTGADVVDRAVLDNAAWVAGVADGWSPHLYVFAGEWRDGAHLYSRLFAPEVGVGEDPATGSACAVVVASLAHQSKRDGTYGVRIDQGVAMGRPSVLKGSARKEDGRLTEVVVSGPAIIIGHGTITLDED